jgi:hypothetical protein
MKTTIFFKKVNKKGTETSKLSNDTKKSISNFHETIPLSETPWTGNPYILGFFGGEKTRFISVSSFKFNFKKCLMPLCNCARKTFCISV